MGYVSFMSCRKPVPLQKRERIEAWKVRIRLKKMRMEGFQAQGAPEALPPGGKGSPLSGDKDRK